MSAVFTKLRSGEWRGAMVYEGAPVIGATKAPHKAPGIERLHARMARLRRD